MIQPVLVSRDATSQQVYSYIALRPQAGTRGVASRFTIDAESMNTPICHRIFLFP